jgi:hypothetical protein
MNVDTGQFAALRDEVAAMRAEVAGLSDVLRGLSAVSAVVYEAGRHDERNAILGGLRPGRRNPSCRDGSRPGHLSLAPDGRRTS